MRKIQGAFWMVVMLYCDWRYHATGDASWQEKAEAAGSKMVLYWDDAA